MQHIGLNHNRLILILEGLSEFLFHFFKPFFGNDFVSFRIDYDCIDIDQFHQVNVLAFSNIDANLLGKILSNEIEDKRDQDLRQHRSYVSYVIIYEILEGGIRAVQNESCDFEGHFGQIPIRFVIDQIVVKAGLDEQIFVRSIF